MHQVQTWLQGGLIPSVMPVNVRMREYAADMDSRSTRFLKSCMAKISVCGLCASVI